MDDDSEAKDNSVNSSTSHSSSNNVEQQQQIENGGDEEPKLDTETAVANSEEPRDSSSSMNDTPVPPEEENIVEGENQQQHSTAELNQHPGSAENDGEEEDGEEEPTPPTLRPRRGQPPVYNERKLQVGFSLFLDSGNSVFSFSWPSRRRRPPKIRRRRPKSRRRWAARNAEPKVRSTLPHCPSIVLLLFLLNFLVHFSREILQFLVQRCGKLRPRRTIHARVFCLAVTACGRRGRRRSDNCCPHLPTGLNKHPSSRTYPQCM